MKIGRRGSWDYDNIFNRIRDSIKKNRLNNKRTDLNNKIYSTDGLTTSRDEFINFIKDHIPSINEILDLDLRELPDDFIYELIPVSKEVFDALTPEEQKEIVDISLGKYGEINKELLEKIGKSENFNNLALEVKVKTLRIFLKNIGGLFTNSFLYQAIESKNFQNLDVNQQEMFLDVFDSTYFQGQSYLLKLLNTKLNNKIVLLDTDKNGNSLLENLYKISYQKLSSEFEMNGITREKILTSILQETSNPGEVNQGFHNTCTVTSMQYILCKNNPAEYARLMSGLISPDGKVEMRNGDILERDKGSIPFDGDFSRSVTERIFQSALMEYANGIFNYDNEKDKNVMLPFYDEIGFVGLYPEMQKFALEALFGKKFTLIYNNIFTNFVNTLTGKNTIIDKLKELSGQDVYIQMKWGVDDSLGHVVVVTKVENGRVYFRNPWGPTADKKGTKYDHPPRILEDPSSRIESMTIEDFLNWVQVIFIPEN